MSNFVVFKIENMNFKSITLSSNANRVPFENLQYYLNKKGKACKVWVNEWRINQKGIIEVSNAGVRGLFQKVQQPF